MIRLKKKPLDENRSVLKREDALNAHVTQQFEIDRHFNVKRGSSVIFYAKTRNM